MPSLREAPSGMKRLKFAAAVSAAAAFVLAGMMFLTGELAALGDGALYHTSRIEPRDAINATCVLFWIVLSIFALTHLHWSEADRREELCAHLARNWMERRRSRLLRRATRRR